MPGAPGPNVLRICKRCGDQYHPKSARQECCNKPIKVPCAVCGTLMDQICTFNKHQKHTCSKRCTTILGNNLREQNAQKLTKICKWCGKEFHPKSARDIYCEGPHYQTCVICGKQFELHCALNKPTHTCSKHCTGILVNKDRDIDIVFAHVRDTIQEKYGVDNVMQLPNIREKIRNTMQERYGADSYTQTEKYRQRVKETCLDKYGVEHHLSSPAVIAKRTETIQKKYGVNNVFQSDQIKEKTKETLRDRYDVEYISQSPEIHKRMYINRENNVAADGELFDSSYERIFYDFLLNVPGLNIETQVPINFIYQDTSHTTLIDFKVNDIYFEVKGSHLLNGVFSDRVQIPISSKLDVYRQNNVVIITDTLNQDVISLFNDGLLGVNISMFDTTSECIAIWDRIMQHVSNGVGFLDK